MRFVLAFLAFLLPAVALAQPQPPPPQAGCRGRNFIQDSPAYLAVNDRCLGSGAVTGDAQQPPATYIMQSGSAALYLAHTAQLLVTLTNSTGSGVQTISPCIARPEWVSKGIIYRMLVYGAGATSTKAAASGAGNVITVASGGTSVPLYAPITDITTPGNLPANTYAIATTGTTITLNNSAASIGTDTFQWGATTNFQISSVNVNGCTVTTSTNPTTAAAGIRQYVTIFPPNNSGGLTGTTATSSTWAQWRYDQCGIAKGSTSLVCPAGTFYQYRDLTQGTSLVSRGASLRTVVAIHDPTAACPDLYAQISSSDAGGDTATLDRAATCAITASNYADVYWGSALFATSYLGNLAMSANMAIDVPGFGTGATGPAPVDLLTTISSVTDYFSATLAANAGANAAFAPQNGWLRVGTDDTVNTLAACNLAGSYGSGYRGCYWPAGVNTFLATVGGGAGSIDGLLQTQRCGEGRIIYPIVSDWHINTSDCNNGPQPYDERMSFVSQDGAQSRADSSANGKVNISLWGDSWTVPGINSVSNSGNIDGMVRDLVQRENRGLTITEDNFSIGGQGIGMMDPNGPSYGHGAGLPGSAPGSLPDFYQTNTSAQWITYPEDDANTLDMLLMRIGANDAYSFLVGSFENVIGTTQSAAWYAQNTKYPDIRMIPGSNAPQSSLSLSGWRGMLIVAGLERSMVDSCWFCSTMQTSRSMGVIDADAWQHRLAEGWDPINVPQRAAMELLPPAAANSTGGGSWGYPFSWVEPVLGYGITISTRQSGVLSNSVFFSNIGNGLCFGAGNGAATTPVNSGTQTGAAVSYSGGALCIDYTGPVATHGTIVGGSSYTGGTYTGVALTGGSGTGAVATIVVSGGAVTTVTFTTNGTGYVVGDTLTTAASNIGGTGSGFSVPVATITGIYTVNRYLYRTVQTQSCAMANSGAGGVGVLTCSTAPTNMGFAPAQVYIAGAGSGDTACPAYMGGGVNCMSGNIPAGGVSSDGKTITFTAPAPTTFLSQSTKIMFYRLQPGDPVTTGGGLGVSGCVPHPAQTSITQLTLYVYIHADGSAGFSEAVNSQFAEGTYRCQWTGKMAGFFEDLYYPTIFTEDNSAHSGFIFLSTNASSEYVSAWEEVPSLTRLAAQFTTVEDSGLCPNYSGLLGGACYGHPASSGIEQIYKRAFENADWNFLP